MNIYKISQNVNNDYDTYKGAVVIAPDEETARNISPDGTYPNNWSERQWAWCPNPEDVIVELIGTTERTEISVVLDSFRAG